MKKIKDIFGNFAYGRSLWQKLIVVYWRIRGCNHAGNFCLDVGDEDHQVWYCFRCDRTLK